MTFDPADTRCSNPAGMCADPATQVFRGVWLDSGDPDGVSGAWLVDTQGRHVRACLPHAPAVMAHLAAFPGCPPSVAAYPFATITREVPV